LDTSKLKQAGHVNDFASKMDPDSLRVLEQYCIQVEQKTGVQLVIVIVNTLDGESAKSAAGRLFAEWAVGSKNENQGMLLLFSVEDKHEAAQIGTGLEAVVPPDFAAAALKRPLLQANDYNRPLIAIAETLGEHIATAKSITLHPPAPAKHKSGWFSPIAIVFYVCVAAMIVGLVSIVPSFMKFAVPTAKSPTTWLTIIVLVLLAILFNFIGYDAAQRVLPSALVGFFESAWPLLVVLVLFVLISTKGHPWEYLLGQFRAPPRGKRHR